jgi:hypothetical protein
MILKEIGSWLGSTITGLPQYLFAKTPTPHNISNAGKDLWAGFYGEEIEEIKEKIKEDIAAELIEDVLIAWQDLVSRSRLAPSIYEAGVNELSEYSHEMKKTELYQGILTNCINKFRQRLINDPTFTQDCLKGDIEQLLPRIQEGRLKTNGFINEVSYFRKVLPNHVYKSVLRSISQKNLTTNIELLNAIEKEIASIGQFESVSVQASPQQISVEMPIETKAVYAEELQTENAEVVNSNGGMLSAIFSTLRSIGAFIFENPGQAITMVLAMQAAAAAALNSSQEKAEEDEEKADFLAAEDWSQALQYSQLDKLAGEGAIEMASSYTQNVLTNHDLEETIFKDAYVSIKARSAGDDIASGVGPEFQITNYGETVEFLTVTGLQNGNFIISWIPENINPNAIKIQEYSVQGTAVGNPILINFTETIFPCKILSLSNDTLTLIGSNGTCGNIWQYSILENNIVSTFQFISTSTLATQFHKSIRDLSGITSLSLPNGDLMLLYEAFCESQNEDLSYFLFGQLFNFDQTNSSTPFLLNVNTGDSGSIVYSAAVTMNDNTPVACVESLIYFAHAPLYLQVFNPAGNISTSLSINNQTELEINNPAITALPDGNIIVTWQQGPDWSDDIIFKDDVYGQIFNISGEPVTKAFMINSFNNNDQYNQAITRLFNGNFIAIWKSLYQDNCPIGVYGQLFSSNSTKIGNEFRINSCNALSQPDNYPLLLTALPNGNCVVVWQEVSFNLPSVSYGKVLQMSLIVTYNDQPQYYTENVPYSLSDLEILAAYNPTSANLTLVCSDPTAGTLATTATSNAAVVIADKLPASWQAIGTITGINQLLSGLQFIPTPYYSKNFTLAIYACDGISPDFNMTIPINGIYVHHDPIVQTAIPAQIVSVGQQYTFTFSANTFKDLDNIPLTYNASLADGEVLPSWLNFNDTSRTFSSTSRVSKNYVGNIQVLVSADDGQGGIVSTTFDITVLPSLFSSNLNNNFQYIENTPFVFPQIFSVQTASPTINVTFTLVDLKAGLLVANNTANATSVFNATQGVWQASGVVSGVNAILNNLVFNPASNYYGDFPITVVVSDGYNYDLTGLISMRGTQSKNPKNKVEDTLIGAIAGGIGLAALMAGAGIGFWRYRKGRHDAESRKNYPFANALRTALKLTEVDDFESGKGSIFVNAVDVLIGELANQDINVREMYENQIEKAASYVAKAIKAAIPTQTGYLSEKLNLLDIQNYATSIARVAKEIRDNQSLAADSVISLGQINPL